MYYPEFQIAMTLSLSNSLIMTQMPFSIFPHTRAKKRRRRKARTAVTLFFLEGGARITKKQHVEKVVKCVTKTAKDSVKEAVTRKQDQHILLKVQDTDLAAREAHYHATCRRDCTREDDRHQDTKTIDEEAANKTTYFQYIVQYVKQITTLREKYETGTFHVSSL